MSARRWALPAIPRAAAALVSAHADVLVVDTAHGHANVLDMVARLRREHPDIDLIAGNVARPKRPRR